eukprot:TRINITY_DN31014_c0_g1_i1.p1 TRINITY_DN31014_c0_g1~~TRINITY_DN31014_c0_g1_i1.p1  ORF type:complete len:307 (+),score=81.70 TRINITY_DN31014_c0_g1_i1:98-1018(+)
MSPCRGGSASACQSFAALGHAPPSNDAVLLLCCQGPDHIYTGRAARSCAFFASQASLPDSEQVPTRRSRIDTFFVADTASAEAAAPKPVLASVQVVSADRAELDAVKDNCQLDMKEGLLKDVPAASAGGEAEEHGTSASELQPALGKMLRCMSSTSTTVLGQELGNSKRSTSWANGSADGASSSSLPSLLSSGEKVPGVELSGEDSVVIGTLRRMQMRSLQDSYRDLAKTMLDKLEETPGSEDPKIDDASVGDFLRSYGQTLEIAGAEMQHQSCELGVLGAHGASDVAAACHKLEGETKGDTCRTM